MHLMVHSKSPLHRATPESTALCRRPGIPGCAHPISNASQMPIDQGRTRIAFMKKVLVIDDDRSLVTMLVETLDLLGFQRLAALDGDTGIQMAIAHQPDLILCDLSMPALDGFGTVWQIRRTETIAQIPFILCSGFTDEATRQKAMKSGANDVI